MYTKQTIISKISNTLLLVFTIFLLFYVWSISVTKKFIISIIVSSTISSVIIGIIIYYKSISNKKSHILSIQNSKIKYIYNQLLLGTTDDIIGYFKHIFNNHQIIDNIFVLDNECIIPLYSSICILSQDVLSLYKKYPHYSITILCLDYDDSVTNLLDDYKLSNIKVKNLTDTIPYFNLQSDYPDFNINITSSKINYKDIVKNIFSKKRIKGYLISSIFIFLYSLYLPYKLIYYLLISILLIFAIVAIFISDK